MYFHYAGNFFQYITDFGEPLILARSYRIAKLLIKHGADLNGGCDGSGDIASILHHFCFTRSKGALQAVLESNAPVNIPNNFGRTALFYASSPEMVVLLVNAGGSVDWADNSGFRPLHYMVSNKESLPLVKALLDAKCDPNTEDNYGRTPLHIVCLPDDNAPNRNIPDRKEELRKRLDTIKLLADYGANFTAKDNEGKAPLDLLLISPHEDSFEEWKLIKELLREVFDAQYNNHGFKRARVFVEEAEI